MLQRYFMELTYKGTRFHGWQIQPGAVSVQETLEHAMTTICRERIQVTGAGRTDSGVHASYYVAHFDASSPLPSEPDFVRRLNSFLDNDIAVWRLTKVAGEAHARFDAVLRTYAYRISTNKDPFARETSWYFSRALDVQAMNEACLILLEYNDFASFSKSHSDAKTNICQIYMARWEQQGGLLTFTISADRFLRNMVRAIVGTMVVVGQGKMPPAGLRHIIEAQDRCAAGVSVPPQGLFLTDIKYSPEVFTRNTDIYIFPE